MWLIFTLYIGLWPGFILFLIAEVISKKFQPYKVKHFYEFVTTAGNTFAFFFNMKTFF